MGSLIVARERVGYGLRSLAICHTEPVPTYGNINKDQT